MPDLAFEVSQISPASGIEFVLSFSAIEEGRSVPLSEFQFLTLKMGRLTAAAFEG